MHTRAKEIWPLRRQRSGAGVRQAGLFVLAVIICNKRQLCRPWNNICLTAVLIAKNKIIYSASE